MKSLPEHIPRLLWVPAHKNLQVIPDAVVLDPVGNRKVAGQLTGRKDRLEVGMETRLATREPDIVLSLAQYHSGSQGVGRALAPKT